MLTVVPLCLKLKLIRDRGGASPSDVGQTLQSTKCLSMPSTLANEDKAVQGFEAQDIAL